MRCYVEPKTGLLTGDESSLDVLLGGRVSHDIQTKILAFLGHEPEFPDELDSTSYIDYYDDLMNRQVFPVDCDESRCFKTDLFYVYEDDFTICREMWIKDDDDAFMEEIYQYNNYMF